LSAVQDTLLKAWQHFLQFRGGTEADFRAWLGQILRHTLANERREHVRTAMRSIQCDVSLDQIVARSLPDDSGSEYGSSGGQTRTLERREALEMALRRLPEHYRQVLNLHTQEEMTFAQVGERLHCTAEVARKLWRRAVEKLARLLGEGNASAKRR
jgi:RNA polymerase sigma-70 factor, ECF subfamily